MFVSCCAASFSTACGHIHSDVFVRCYAASFSTACYRLTYPSRCVRSMLRRTISYSPLACPVRCVRLMLRRVLSNSLLTYTQPDVSVLCYAASYILNSLAKIPSCLLFAAWSVVPSPFFTHTGCSSVAPVSGNARLPHSLFLQSWENSSCSNRDRPR